MTTLEATLKEIAMYKHILVAVDGSTTSNKALVAALELAREHAGRVRLVHAVDELAYLTGFEYTGDLIAIVREYGAKVLADAAAVARAAGVEADTRLVEAAGQRLADLVADEARGWGADLIVVGTHGRRGVGRVVLGSGAEQIIRTAPVPVLVIRGAPGTA
jgi:nucleotide-binding universal stress UspA family protein